jgi:hypothetical protein
MGPQQQHPSSTQWPPPLLTTPGSCCTSVHPHPCPVSVYYSHPLPANTVNVCHRFHAKCIDPWLASRRLCPVCKHDASTWPSNSLQAALSGPMPLDAATPTAAAAASSGGMDISRGGVNLLSVPLSAGVVSLVGRGYWFRRLRARLARASRRRQQQQQEQLQLQAGGGAMSPASPAAAAAAAAEAAEAGLLQPPPAAVTLDVHQGQVPLVMPPAHAWHEQQQQQQPGVQQQEASMDVPQPVQQQQQPSQQQQQQQQRRQRRRPHGQGQPRGLQQPLLDS